MTRETLPKRKERPPETRRPGVFCACCQAISFCSISIRPKSIVFGKRSVFPSAIITAENRKRSTLFFRSSVSVTHLAFASGPMRSAIASGDLTLTIVFFWFPVCGH